MFFDLWILLYAQLPTSRLKGAFNSIAPHLIYFVSSKPYTRQGGVSRLLRLTSRPRKFQVSHVSQIILWLEIEWVEVGVPYKVHFWHGVFDILTTYLTFKRPLLEFVTPFIVETHEISAHSLKLPTIDYFIALSRVLAIFSVISILCSAMKKQALFSMSFEKSEKAILFVNNHSFFRNRQVFFLKISTDNAFD